jgi:hypothetical protein
MSALLLNLMLLALVAAEPTPKPSAAPQVAPTATPPIAILLKKQGSGGDTGGQDLAAVAKKIKLKLPADQPRRLDNESVHQLAQGVELTQVKNPPPPLEVAGGGGSGDSDDAGKKRFWVGLYQQARAYEKGLEDRVPELDGEVNRLRNEFYRTDDPAQRDGVIKPAWDKAMADWEQAKVDLEQAHGLAGKVMEAARQDGAAPGWFRGLPEPEPSLNKPAIPDSGRSKNSPRDESAPRY